MAKVAETATRARVKHSGEGVEVVSGIQLREAGQHVKDIGEGAEAVSGT